MYYFNHKQRCEQQGIMSIRNPNKSHPYWKNHCLKNPLYFRNNADFEVYYQIDTSNIENKTIKINRQNTVLNG